MKQTRQQALDRTSLRILMTVIAAFLVSLCSCNHIDKSLGSSYRTVSFPQIQLAEGERIESVEVVIGCGRFTAINRIPNDWSVEVTSPVSETTQLNASAGHGISSLENSDRLDNFITIWMCDSCFTIEASIVVFTPERKRIIAFTQSELLIKPLPGDFIGANGQ